MTCMENRIQYNGKTSTDTAGLETIIIHANHVISSPGAKFCDVSMDNFHVNIFLPKPVYVNSPKGYPTRDIKQISPNTKPY